MCKFLNDNVNPNDNFFSGRFECPFRAEIFQIKTKLCWIRFVGCLAAGDSQYPKKVIVIVNVIV